MSFYYPYKKSYKKYGWKKGVSKSSKYGTKKVTVVIPVESDYHLDFASGSMQSNVIPLAPCRPVNDSSCMTITSTYKAYANLYDEARIVGVKVKWYFGGGFTSTTGYFTFASSVDRCMMSEDLTSMPSVNEILASSSVSKTVFTTQQRLGAFRSYWASNMMEKNTWWDTTLDSNNRYPPALLDSTTAFKPVVFFCAVAPSAGSSSQQLPYRVEAEWIVQFRNPKMVLSNQNKFSEMRAEAIEEKKEESEEAPVLKKKKVVYEEEVLPDDEDEEMDEESQEPLTQPVKTVMKKAGKKSS